MRPTIALIIGTILLSGTPAHAAIEVPKAIKNCVNIKTGEARLLSTKATKCNKGEKLVKIVIPAVEPDSLVHTGSGKPIDFQTGHDGDFYIDAVDKKVYGPRVAGLWGAGASMVGEVGPIGKAGAALISGITAPDFQTGFIGDFYLDVNSKLIYGPKNERTGWGVGSPITGPQGSSGATGPPGPPGPAGNNGTNGLNGGFGSYGSFYDTSTVTLTQFAATPIPLNQTSLANGISIIGGSKVTFAVSGKFNLAFSTQLLKEDNGTDTVTIWLCKGTNGGVCNNVPWSSTDLYLVGADARYVAAWNFFLNVQSGDYYQLMITSSGTTLKTKILSAPAQTNPVRPEVPGTILTVNQVG
jgi:hypothetical protein